MQNHQNNMQNILGNSMKMLGNLASRICAVLIIWDWNYAFSLDVSDYNYFYDHNFLYIGYRRT
jgi:hypothetical protein